MDPYLPHMNLRQSGLKLIMWDQYMFTEGNHASFQCIYIYMYIYIYMLIAWHFIAKLSNIWIHKAKASEILFVYIMILAK